MSVDLPRDIWKDPGVKERLKEGRQAFDIQCLRCPECNNLGYYNQGSSFSCRFCDLTFRVDVDMIDDMVSLADTVTETTDGYDNHTP